MIEHNRGSESQNPRSQPDQEKPYITEVRLGGKTYSCRACTYDTLSISDMDTHQEYAHGQKLDALLLEAEQRGYSEAQKDALEHIEAAYQKGREDTYHDIFIDLERQEHENPLDYFERVERYLKALKEEL